MAKLEGKQHDSQPHLEAFALRQSADTERQREGHVAAAASDGRRPLIQLVNECVHVYIPAPTTTVTSAARMLILQRACISRTCP